MSGESTVRKTPIVRAMRHPALALIGAVAFARAALVLVRGASCKTAVERMTQRHLDGRRTRRIRAAARSLARA